MSAIITEQELTSELVIGGFRYWQSKRHGNPIPARCDFDPLLEVPALVRFMMLKDVQRDPLDFRYRLVGTAVAARFGHDRTGERFSALPQQSEGSEVWKTAVRILEERRPIVSHIAYVGLHRWVSNYRDISMPLSENNDVVNMIFGVLQFET